MYQYSNSIEDSSEKSFNLREQIEGYLSYWKWFVVGVAITISVAFIYLCYAVPLYSASSTILVKDERKGGLASELSAFSDLGMLKNVKSNVDNEIEVIKSRTLVEKTVKDLGLNISYINEGRIKDGEIYKDSPIVVFFSNQNEQFYKENHKLRVVAASASTYTLYDETGNKRGVFKYGETIKYKSGTCSILKNNLEPEKNKTEFSIRIEIQPVLQVAESYKARLKVMALSKNTSVIELSFVDPVLYRAEDFLDALVRNYNQDAIDDKNFISENTSEFEKREIETETQLKVVNTMLDYMKNTTNENLIPANILTSDVNAVGLIDQYNQLVLERNRILKTAGPKNSMVLAVDKKIASLKSNVSSSLNQLKASLQIKKNDLARQNAIVDGRISQIPTQEKEFRIIARQQQVKEALYLYLLEKREETALSLAVTEPNAKVIDQAHAALSPVSPNRKVVYIVSLFLGLFIPFAIIYLIRLFDTKVKSRLDIEKATTMPFIGDVPKAETSEQIISTNSRTSTAEALRIVRTNLEFLLNEVPEGVAKTIFLTSTFPKEGKTFISVNLASTIALSDKKVLLVGLDIRNPKLEEYLVVPKVGITNYLASKEYTNIEDFITKVDGFSNFYALQAGVIPPNPAELLMGKKVGELFEKLKQDYDYIIVDTAPVSLVTDTLLIAKYADTFIYVTRANYLDKRMLSLPEKLYQEKKLPNMSILINDTDSTKGYGYGYGYGYGLDEKPASAWKRLFKK